MRAGAWRWPGEAAEVAEDILNLVFLQLAEFRELWEDDDGVAVRPAAPWRHRFTIKMWLDFNSILHKSLLTDVQKGRR